MGEVSMLKGLYEPLLRLQEVQWLFLALFALTAVIGINAIFFFNAKRRGFSGRSGLSPFNFPIRTFNSAEWIALAVVFLISFAFGLMAIVSGS